MNLLLQSRKYQMPRNLDSPESDREKKPPNLIQTNLNGEKRAKSRPLTKLYVAALSTVAGLSIAGQALVQFMLVQQSHNANTINTASNERTLSQQLSKAALVIDFATDPEVQNESLAELKTVTQKLQKSHLGLQQGDDKLNLKGNNSETVTELFAEIEPYYHGLISSAEGLVELLEKEQSGEIISPSIKRVLVQKIVSSEANFSEWMNKVALQYSVESQARVNKLKNIELFLLFITLTVLFLEGIFIFRPTVKQIVTTIEELLKTQSALEKSQSRYRAIVEDQTELICRFLPDGTIAFINSAFCNYFAQEQENLLAKKLTSLNSTHNWEVLTQNINCLTPDNPVISVEQDFCKSHENNRSLQWTSSGIFDSEGNLVEIQSVGRDITEQKRAEYLAKEKIRLETEIIERQKSEEALRIAEEKYRNIFENAVEGLFQISPQGRFLSANPALARIYGYESPKQIITELVEFQNQLYVNSEDYTKLQELLEERKTIANFELEVYRRDGSKIWISKNIRSVYDRESNLSHYEGSVFDITDRKKAQNQLIKSALYDNLTDLPNRTLFIERLNNKVKIAKKKDRSLFAVLFVDLDRFKAVNDTLGHEVGDMLLIEIARRLESAVRIDDTVCRWGGDEFVILLNSIESKEDAIKIADRILEKLTLPLVLEEHQLFPSGSVGMTMSSHRYDTPEDLLRNADAAMYQAKAKGKCCYHIFQPTDSM